MAKTICFKLSPQIIADFESCFDKKEDERAYLYQNSTKTINEGIGDAFIKKTINLKLVKDNKAIIKPSTFDEINFDGTDLKSNPEWETKEIAGKLEPFEYVIGDSFWNKINNWIKLSSILNRKFNESLVENDKKILADLKSDANANPTLIKQKEDALIKSEEKVNDLISEECIESYVFSLFSGIIINKIKTEEQERLDKEFEEINKPKKAE